MRTFATIALASVAWVGASVTADRLSHNLGFSLIVGALAAGVIVFVISLAVAGNDHNTPTL